VFQLCIAEFIVHIAKYSLNMFGHQRLFENYDSFIFISPHLDDAVLSCGQLIMHLRKLEKKIRIITVFTKASADTTTPQAREFVELCGYGDASKLFADRKKEDRAVADYIGIKINHWAFLDAAWRKGVDNKPIYPNGESQFSGKISGKDNMLINEISSKLKLMFSNQKDKYLILAPLSIGGHADHVIIREIIRKMNCPKLFWEDFPYDTNRKFLRTFFHKNKKFSYLCKLCSLSFSKKEKAIRFYKSQIHQLFPSGRIPHISERYYFARNSKPF
jgi:LmbE family N-acetylglucosaminyl deacetylase